MEPETNKEVWVSEEPPALPTTNPAVKPLWEALR